MRWRWAKSATATAWSAAAEDATVGIWDATSDEPLGDPMLGHTGELWWVALGRIMLTTKYLDACS